MNSAALGSESFHTTTVTLKQGAIFGLALPLLAFLPEGGSSTGTSACHGIGERGVHGAMLLHTVICRAKPRGGSGFLSDFWGFVIAPKGFVPGREQ